MSAFEFDRALVHKCGRPGHRYTSYPTAPQFNSAFALDDYHQAVRASHQVATPEGVVGVHPHPVLPEPLLLLRLPQDHHPQDPPGRGVPGLPQREIQMQAALFERSRRLTRIAPGRRHIDLSGRYATGRADGLPGRTLHPG